jgi:hypothetical protein
METRCTSLVFLFQLTRYSEMGCWLRLTRWRYMVCFHHRKLRRQNVLPLGSQPCGHDPFGGRKIASGALADGLQNDPLAR